MVAQALTDHFFALIYRFALALLDDPLRARDVTIDTLTLALLNLFRYRSSIGVEAWLYGFALSAIHKENRHYDGQQDLFTRYGLQRSVGYNGISQPRNSAESAVWQEFDRLDRHRRQTALLFYLAGLTPIQIAATTHQGEDKIISHLHQVRATILQALVQTEGRENISQQDIENDRLDAEISRSLQQRWIVAPVSPSEVTQIADQVQSIAAQRGLKRKSVTRFKEVIFIALIILSAVAVLWTVNQWMPEPPSSQVAAILTSTASPPERRNILYLAQPGDSLESIASNLGVPLNQLNNLNLTEPGAYSQSGQLLQITLEPNQIPQPTAVTPVNKPAPLSIRSTSNEILQRIEQSDSLWATLWMDLQVIWYGPENYIGPARAYRYQAWISQPNQSQELFGLLGEAPYRAYLVTSRTNYISRPGARQIYIDNRNLLPEGELLPSLATRQMAFPGHAAWLKQPGTFQPIKVERLAGRQTLMVNWLNRRGIREASIWLDARTGILIRLQQYTGNDYGTLLSDSMITAIEYDHDFDPQLYDPQAIWGDGFATDHHISTTRDIPQSTPTRVASVINRDFLPRLTPPSAFNPASSHLAFQYPPSLSETHQENNSSYPQAELLGDGYYLGMIPIGAPWAALCARSADGQLIAFARGTDGLSRTDGFFGWLELSAPQDIYQPFERINATQFAFSPDSRRLAVFGTTSSGSALFLLDIATGQKTELLQLSSARGLSWSSDGKYLAVIARRSSLAEALMVINVNNHQIVNGKQNGLQEPAPPDDLIRQWRILSPAATGGLEACALPANR